jgi:hypothetical protein
MFAKAGMVVGLLALATLLLVGDSFHGRELELHSGMGQGASSRMLVLEYVEIAREAYLYSAPLLQSYRLLYQEMAHAGEGEAIASFNNLRQWRQISAGNRQSLESRGWLDLRSEPMLVSVPEGFSVRSRIKVSDLYGDAVTHWQGSENGGEGGIYLIASVSWQGEAPPGIDRVIRSRTDLVWLQGSSLAVNTSELEALQAWHRQIALMPLSAYSETPPPFALPPLVLPSWSDSLARTAGFIPYTNFMLSFVHPQARDLEQLRRFQHIGIEAGVLEIPRRHSGAIAAGVEQALHALASAPAGQGAGPDAGEAARVATIRPI